LRSWVCFFFFFQAEDGIRDRNVTGVQTCALPIFEAREATAVDLSGSGIEDELGGTSQMFLAQLGADDFPGTSVVGIRPDGKIWRYNLETGHGDVLATDIEGAPATTMSLAPGGEIG